MTTPHSSEVPQKSRTSSEQVPLVSIGVATHNAERFVAQSLDSILSLDYPRLEIIVNDNGSTDETVDIVRRCIAGDDRVRFTTWTKNRGAAANFNYLMRNATGKYLMWASDHDLWEQNYVRALVHVLEEDAGCVLAYPTTAIVDSDGVLTGTIDQYPDVTDRNPRRRYEEILWNLITCDMVYGLFRRDALRSSWGILSIAGPDRLLLAQMALRGTFVRIDVPMYYRRQNRPTDESPEAAQAQLDRVIGASEPTTPAMTESEGRRAARDYHLRLVREELHGLDAIAAEAATRSSFHYRFGVRDPIAVLLHPGLRTRRNLRRWFERQRSRVHR